MLLRVAVIISLFMLHLTNISAAPVTDYLPKETNFLSQIPTPKSILGFGIGERHARHDQLVRYFKQLASHSTRVKLTNMGNTNEYREQLLVTISAPNNLKNLTKLLKQRRAHQADVIDQPNVVWLGYSVHGDEISGANAAMVVAYYLAASTNEQIKKMLNDTIIVMEPSINPDGMDRFVTWVNMFRGSTANADPNHIEHHQGWFTGRTNHFGFDLNRDWLLLTQVESQHRMKFYQQYQPNVLGDYHEMGRNSSFFFQPGVLDRTNPLTPKANIALTALLAQYHAKALDKNDRLYFTQESYDDFYYGKGSTYPDINGAVGILFEQASSRGFEQQGKNGLVTFQFGIQNHVTTSLSTLQGAWQNRQKLAQYRASFYQQAIKLAKKEKFNGYLVHEAKDPYRLNLLLSTLAQHQIKVYPLEHDFRLSGEVFSKQSSYYIPLKQPQYRVIKALFDQPTKFVNNTFYDVSGWTLPLAMNIETHKVERTWGLKLSASPWQQQAPTWQQPAMEQYAYVFKWSNYLAPKLLNELMAQHIQARVTTLAFQANVAGKMQQFSAGDIVIPAGIQTQLNWQSKLFQLSKTSNIPLFGMTSGLTSVGPDIGSNALVRIKPVSVLLIGGQGVSQYEAGELLFYLDKTLGIPVTMVEQTRLASIDLSHYSHIFMVDGDYKNLSEQSVAHLDHWLKHGGVLFGQKHAAKWFTKQNWLKVNFINRDRINQSVSSTDLQYQDRAALAARQRIAGAIFNTQVDVSNPLAYGLTKHLPVFLNSTLMMETTSKPFITIAKYTNSPLMSGYIDANMQNNLANTPALVAHSVGKGLVIATNDVFAFRGYWYGTEKILANSLFFANALQVNANE